MRTKRKHSRKKHTLYFEVQREVRIVNACRCDHVRLACQIACALLSALRYVSHIIQTARLCFQIDMRTVAGCFEIDPAHLPSCAAMSDRLAYVSVIWARHSQWHASKSDAC